MYIIVLTAEWILNVLLKNIFKISNTKEPNVYIITETYGRTPKQHAKRSDYKISDVLLNGFIKQCY